MTEHEPPDDEHDDEHDSDGEGFVDHDSGRDRLSRIVAVTEVTPHLRRITLSGDTADVLDNGGDQHLTVNFHEPGAAVPHPLPYDLAVEMNRFVLTQMRRYTVRRFHGDPLLIDIDAFIHADGGPGSRWAERARVGDEVRWWGPTSGWHPRPETTTLLLTGDETALPTIEVYLREARDDLRVLAVVEVGDEADRHYLDEIADRGEITWVASGERGAGSADLLAALADVTERAGIEPGATERIQAWGAAEYTTVQGLRRHFLGYLGLTRQDAYLVTYWTHGRAQDARYERRQAAEVARNRVEDPETARRFLPGL